MSFCVSESNLALLAGHDLPAWKRWLVERHLRNCQECSAQLAAYRLVREELSLINQTTEEPPAWLARRILAAAAAEVPAPQLVPRQIGALAGLVGLALLLVIARPDVPGRNSYQASAGPSSVVSESVGRSGRHRMILYTEGGEGIVDVSAGSGQIGVAKADPSTGAVRITRIRFGEAIE